MENSYRRIIAGCVLVALVSPLYAETLEEVVVTARKREESLMDAPLAVSAFSSQALEFRGINDLEGLGDITPNLVLNKSPTNSGVSSAAIYIRGIGQNDYVPVIDPGVGIYVDGVYLGRSVGAVLDLIDIDRVEVLRGPQGTLFGRNTIGGAIVVTTREPEENFSGEADVEIGTDGRLNMRGALNVPLAEGFYGRVSLASFQQDGYVKRTTDGVDLGDDDTLAARMALRWTPTDDLEANLSFDYSRDRENGPPLLTTGMQPINTGLFGPGGAPSMVLIQNTITAQTAEPGGIFPGSGPYYDPAQPFPFNPTACFTPGTDDNPLCYNQQYISGGSAGVNAGNGPAYAKLDTWGASLSLEWHISHSLSIKSITAWRELDGNFAADTDTGPLTMGHVFDTYEQQQLSQEFQFTGTGFNGALDWMLGLYYFREEGENINEVDFASVRLHSGGTFDFESWAAYSQVTWHVIDNLHLTLGLRYTDDTRGYLPDMFITGLPVGPLPGVNCPPRVPGSPPCMVGDRVVPYETVSRNTAETVPMVNLAYRWNDRLMTYASYTEGFKSGGFTQRVFPPEPSLPAFDPEYVTSYEVGAKFEGWNRRLRLNTAAYFADYTDLQLLVADPSRLGPFVSNAGDAEIRGVEVELTFLPAPGWVISASLGLTDMERTSLSGGVHGLTLDSRFEHISEWTANAQIHKALSIGTWGTITPRLEWAFRSEYGTNSNNIPRDHVPTGPAGTPLEGVPLSLGVPNPALVEDDLNLWNASVRWDIRDGDWSVVLGARNLTDEKYRIFGSYEDNFGWTTEAFDRGRQVYVRLDVQF